MMRGVAASMAILCLRALAQETACTIGGTVVDEATHKPVVKARVIAEVPGSYTLVKLTDARGSFCFEALTPASYRILVQKAGYMEFQTRPLVVEEGSPIKPMALEMTQLAGIAGVVLDADGDLLPGAEVTVSDRVRDKGG